MFLCLVVERPEFKGSGSPIVPCVRIRTIRMTMAFSSRQTFLWVHFSDLKTLRALHVGGSSHFSVFYKRSEGPGSLFCPESPGPNRTSCRLRERLNLFTVEQLIQPVSMATIKTRRRALSLLKECLPRLFVYSSFCFFASSSLYGLGERETPRNSGTKQKRGESIQSLLLLFGGGKIRRENVLIWGTSRQ